MKSFKYILLSAIIAASVITTGCSGDENENSQASTYVTAPTDTTVKTTGDKIYSMILPLAKSGLLSLRV